MKKLLLVLLSLHSSLLFAQQDLSIIESNNKFGFDFFHKINKNENIIFSPSSIVSAMAMTYVGAKNNTFNEISNTFYFNKDIDQFSSEYFKLYNYSEERNGFNDRFPV